MTIFSENSCHFDNLVSFSKMSQKSDYCFSLTHDSNLKPNFYHQLSWMLNMKNCWEQPIIFFCLHPKLTSYRRQKHLDVNKKTVVPDNLFKFSIKDGVNDIELNILRNPCSSNKLAQRRVLSSRQIYFAGH